MHPHTTKQNKTKQQNKMATINDGFIPMSFCKRVIPGGDEEEQEKVSSGDGKRARTETALTTTLDTGAVEKLAKGLGIDAPRLQVVKLSQRPSNRRHLLELSDGVHTITAYTQTALDHLVVGGQIDVGTIFRLTQRVLNIAVGGKLAISILGIDDIQSTSTILGSPVPIDIAGRDPALSLVGSPKRAPSGVMQQPPDRVDAGLGPGAPITQNDVGSLHPSRSFGAIVVVIERIKGPFAFKSGKGSVCKLVVRDGDLLLDIASFNKDCIGRMQTLTLGDVYTIEDRKATVKRGDERYRTENAIEYEVVLGGEAQFTHVKDDEGGAEKKGDEKNMKKKTTIRDIHERFEVKSTVDAVSAVVVRVQRDVSSIQRRDGSGAFAKRRLYVVDDSGEAIEVSLFGKNATNPLWDTITIPTPISIRNAMVDAAFGGDGTKRALSAWDRCTIIIEKPEGSKLMEWVNRGVNDANTEDGSSTVCGGIAFVTCISIHQDSMYLSCGKNSAHMQMLTILPDGNVVCPACPDGFNTMKESDAVWRWRFVVEFSDDTGSVAATAFDAEARAILGIDAKHFKNLNDSEKETFISSRKYTQVQVAVSVEPIVDRNTGITRVRRTVSCVSILNPK